jgi:pyruvate dehydrogenase E2 component (dihydrolipoamide acetyltransferase)
MSELVPVILPQLNVNDESVLMVRWLVDRGARVSPGDDICIVETSKAATELAAEQGGVILPLAAPGTMVRVGERIAVLGDDVERMSAVLNAEATAPKKQPAPGPLRATPKAEALVREHGISLEAVAATGARGTIKESDVQRYMSSRSVGVVKPEMPAPSPASPVLPAAIASIALDKGPLTKHDIAVMQNLRASMNRVLLATVSADVGLEAINAAVEAYVTKGTLVTPFHCLLLALGRVLPRFPRLLRFVHDSHYYQYDRIDVALVVRTPDGRLFTPIVRALDTLGLDEIARQAQALGMRAARNKLQAEDLSGAAFTVSFVNAGVAQFTALPNNFQSAILAMTGQRQIVRAKAGAPAIVPVATLTLSYDHAVCDGHDAAEFLTALVAEMEAAQA